MTELGRRAADASVTQALHACHARRTRVREGAWRVSVPFVDSAHPAGPPARRELLLAGLALAACRRPPGERAAAAAVRPITIKGSDTMVTLGQRWAEVYMNKHPEVSIQVTGGGSGTGISAIINGTTDICQASRKMRDKEQQMMLDRHGARAIELEVARDGLAIYARADNPVGEISMAQIQAVFRGQLTNWRELGGPDAPIVLYSRENNSGTYEFFKELVLHGADFAPATQHMPGTAAVVNAVSKERWGIGYGGAAYGRGIRILRVRADEHSPAVEPSDATIRDGSYPLSRPLQFYLARPPEGRIKDFLDWVLGPEGQALVTTVGYYPV